MKILYEEDLDIAEKPEISLVCQVGKIKWKALQSQIFVRLIMKTEDRTAIREAGMETMPSIEIDSFNNQCNFQSEIESWQIK